MYSLKFSQRGFTLIEILIALTLSIIIILAMLRAFVTTGKVTAEASVGAQVDSNMMLGLIAADRILQGIGFGDAASYGTNFKAYKFNDGSDIYNVTANSSDNAEYLVWQIDTGKCQALRNASNGLLIYGQDAGYDCTALSKPDVDGNPGDPSERLIQINDAVQNIQFEDSKTADKKIAAIHIAVIEKQCWPFGIVNTTDMKPGKYQVIIRANTYAASTESAARTIQNSTCLFNFK